MRYLLLTLLMLPVAPPALAALDREMQSTAAYQARQVGVRTCLPAIERLEAWLSRGQTGSVVSFWDNANPDQSLFSALIALENKSGNTQVSLNAMPLPDGQCMIEYTQTGYVPLACADYLKSMGNAARFVRDLNSKTALIQGQNVQITLSPVGPNGCLSVRKQLIKQPGLPEPETRRETGKTSSKSSSNKRR